MAVWILAKVSQLLKEKFLPLKAWQEPSGWTEDRDHRAKRTSPCFLILICFLYVRAQGKGPAYLPVCPSFWLRGHVIDRQYPSSLSQREWNGIHCTLPWNTVSCYFSYFSFTNSLTHPFTPTCKHILIYSLNYKCMTHRGYKRTQASTMTSVTKKLKTSWERSPGREQ